MHNTTLSPMFMTQLRALARDAPEIYRLMTALPGWTLPDDAEQRASLSVALVQFQALTEYVSAITAQLSSELKDVPAGAPPHA